MQRMIGALLVALALQACVTATQKRADAAFARGDYLSATQYYDGALKEKPTNEKLIAKRWLSRSKAVDELVLRASGMREAKKQQAALSLARAAVEARNDWFSARDRSRLPAEAHARVDELANWAVTTAGATIRAELDAKRPLAARSASRSVKGLFSAAGLLTRYEVFRNEVNSAGQTRCAELKAALTDGSAHLAHWVAAYCRAFDVGPPTVPASPEQVGALKIQSDTLSPTSPEQRQRLEQQLEKLLATTSWFHTGAGAMASANISGSHTALFSQQAASREAHWIEQVPYQVQEAYQESYTETQYYTAQESYTTYRSESYSCGYGTTSRTCSRSVPNTQYRTVQKTRPVTKSRTKYRTVTRHRDEPRIFKYDAIEHRAQYNAAWHIFLTFGDATPALEVHLRGALDAKDDEHNVSFVPAGVRPVRSRLMSHEAWFSDRLKLLEADFRSAVHKHWQQQFCDVGANSDEQAARCARGMLAATPESAKQVLSAFLRDDAALLLAGGA